MDIITQVLNRRHFLHYFCHVVLSAVLGWLAFVFLDSEDTFSTSPSFRAMAKAMTEEHWGWFTGISAVIGVSTVLTDSWKARSFGAATLAAAHLVIAVEIYIGNPNGTGTGAYAGYAFLGAALAYSTAHLGSRNKKDLATPDPPG